MMETKANECFIMEVEDDKVVYNRKITLSNKFSIKIDWFKFIKKLIFSKGHRCWLRCCIEYAMNRENEIRGDGASDVVAFNVYFKDVVEKVYKEDKEEN